jgi:ectoine hydroxylase-related dioxygenase (phytanoyl-CoA dioxygenase family)
MLAIQVFKEDLVYQSLPTIRVHFQNNLSVGGYHRDREYNHPNEEINIWIPLTKAYKTASIHIEPSIGEKHHQPVNIDIGQYVIFDSALEHGNEVNVEGYTRLSFDFRVIPYSQYKESRLDSITQKIRFRIGEYYNVMRAFE